MQLATIFFFSLAPASSSPIISKYAFSLPLLMDTFIYTRKKLLRIKGFLLCSFLFFSEFHYVRRMFEARRI